VLDVRGSGGELGGPWGGDKEIKFEGGPPAGNTKSKQASLGGLHLPKGKGHRWEVRIKLGGGDQKKGGGSLGTKQAQPSAGPRKKNFKTCNSPSGGVRNGGEKKKRPGRN